MAYFDRVDASTFTPTALVSGGWNPDEQHIAPALGLLAHAVETEQSDGRQLARLSYDILGTLPIEPVQVQVEVLRPGRTVELVQATLSHGGRAAVVLRAWLLSDFDTDELAGGSLAAVPGPDDLPVLDPAGMWPGEFVRSVEVRRRQEEPGRALSWVRTAVPLLRDEPVSATARALGLVDIANGLTPRRPATEVAFPNVDLTVHLSTALRGEWIGLDTTVEFGPTGLGLTHSVLHDVRGPVGVVSQSLTVRPRRSSG